MTALLNKSIFYCALKLYWLLLMPDALGCSEVNRDQGAPGRFTWYLLGMSGPSVVADTPFLTSPLTHSLDGAHSSTQAPVLQPDMPCPVPEWLLALCPSPGTVGAGKEHSRTQDPRLGSYVCAFPRVSYRNAWDSSGPEEPFNFERLRAASACPLCLSPLKCSLVNRF